MEVIDIGTENFGGVAARSAYSQSFGLLPIGTNYVDVKSGIDMREKLNDVLNIGLKALTSTSGGVVPVYVDPRIVDYTRKYTPLCEIIPRVTNFGVTADYNVITDKGAARTAAEDAALSEMNTTFSRASTAIKYLYAVGRVTGQAQAAIPSYMLAGMLPSTGASQVSPFADQSAANAKQMAVLIASRALKELEENLIINGNRTTSGVAGNPNGSEFDGIITLQGTTNEVDKNATALSLDDINLAIRYAFDDGGRPNIAVCSSDLFNDLMKLLTAKIGYMNPIKSVFWGYETIVLNTMVGQIPVIPSMFMSNTSGSKAIYFLDLSVWEMRVLQDMTYEELAKANDSEKFMLKIYEALICKSTSFNSFVGNIS